MSSFDAPELTAPPSEYFKRHCVVSVEPDEITVKHVIDYVGSKNLVFSTDYPHWQFDGEHVLPEGISSDLVRKIMIDNPLATYPRLRDGGA